MGEKISTIILKVDLDCRKCYKKISKTICKLQERENIQYVNFDEKNNTVTISGPFDPKKLCKKLCCKASKVIKDIQIKEEKEKPKPKEDKPKEDKPKPKEDKPKEDKPKPKEDKPKEDKPKPKEDEKPKELQPGPPAPKEVEADPVFVAQEPELGFQPGGPWPGPGCTCGCRPWPGPGCTCGCRPWYGGYYGDCKCPWCGRGYGWAPECPPQIIYVAPPPQPPPQPCGGYKTCTFICEEDPQSSCRIM